MGEITKNMAKNRKTLINSKENEYKRLIETADNEFDINSLRSKIADDIKWIELNKCIRVWTKIIMQGTF